MTVLDCLVKEGYDLDKAKKIVWAGLVRNKGSIVFSPHEKVFNIKDVLVIKKSQWVSRGALKLLEAIKCFALEIKEQVCLDIGSSTGGFTQVLLKHGAKKVYALDVGTNQLDYALRVNKQVVVMEKTNLKTINLSMFKEELNLVVTDVSFISLKAVFTVLKDVLKSGTKVMALIKPQYEADSNLVETGGYVSKKYHQDVINRVKIYAKDNDFMFVDLQQSPIKGLKSKNIEYISLFKKR